MELNASLFSNASSDNETSSTESDTEAKPNSFLIYLNLFGLPFGVLLVVVPALSVIIIILKNKQLRKESGKIFYANVLIADVIVALTRWIICSTIIICHLLDVPNVNCSLVTVALIGSQFATQLMFLPVVIDRFLHIVCPFSYKKMFTIKRMAAIISGLWLLSIAFGVLSLVGEEYTVNPEVGVCEPTLRGFFFQSLALIILGSQVSSMAIITGTCIYLRYKVIHSKRFFNSMKKNTAEEKKAVKVGRLMEILQEQVQPTVSVFITQGIDAVFNVLGIIIFLVAMLNLDLPILGPTLLAIQLCKYFIHAVVYGMHDKQIRKEIKGIYEKIRGSKKSKITMLNGQ